MGSVSKQLLKWNEILNLRSQIKTSSRQRILVKERWSEIITNIARQIPMNIIAEMVGVSERTIWRVLRELQINTKEIVKAYELYQKEKEKKVIEKIEKIKAPPTDYERFRDLEIIKEFIDYCVSRRRTKRKIAIRYVGIIYRACKKLMIHPVDLNKEVVEKYIDDLIKSLGELIREESYAQAVSFVISAFRVFSEFRGFTITHKTTEYSGEWDVYFTLDDRRNLYKLAYKIYNKKLADFVVDMMEFYFTTGCRAKAITTIFNVKEYGDFVEIWVKEKGKKKEYKWKKIIPKQLWLRVKKYLPMTEKKLRKLRSLLQKLYAVYFGLDKDLVKKIKSSTLFGLKLVRYKYDENTKKISKNGKWKEKMIETPLTSDVLKELEERVGIEKARLVYYALRHPLHIWRHTFAKEMLKFTRYNYEVVAVLGGWVKVNTLERVYGRLEYDKAFELAFGRFEPEPFRFI